MHLLILLEISFFFFFFYSVFYLEQCREKPLGIVIQLHDIYKRLCIRQLAYYAVSGITELDLLRNEFVMPTVRSEIFLLRC